jgi:hypothetical protein
LRIVYAGWDNANVVQPDGCGQARMDAECGAYAITIVMSAFSSPR